MSWLANNSLVRLQWQWHKKPKGIDWFGEPDHLLEIQDNLEILEILEIPSTKRPLS